MSDRLYLLEPSLITAMKEDEGQEEHGRKEISRYKRSINKNKASKWDNIVQFKNKIKNKRKAELRDLKKSLIEKQKRKKESSVPSKEIELKLAVIELKIKQKT